MRPPRLAARLVARRCPEDAEFLIGDLDEGFHARAARMGRLRAAIWYWAHALRIAAAPRPAAASPSIGVFAMFLLRNFALALRTAFRRPLISLTVVVTLALAIGANAVIFGMVDMLTLRPLPIRTPERVGWIFGVDESRGFDRLDVSPADYLDFRDAGAFTHLMALAPAAYTMTGRGDARRVDAFEVTSSLFDVWGLDVAHGRRFEPGDEQAGAQPVALLMHTFWLREFEGKPDVIGQSLMLSGRPHVIAGVLGPELNFGDLATIEVWTPYVTDRATASRSERRLAVMGLLRDGATIESASAEIGAISQRIAREHPATHASWSARVISAREGMTGGETWLILALLVITVTMVLLIACANVANILLAATAGRVREIAVRTALGAGRRHIVAQLLAEATVLAAAGGALGLALAYGAIELLRVVARGNFFFEALGVNYRVALFAVALSFAAPALFALLPALQATRQGAGAFAEQGLRSIGTRRSRRTRGALVVAQIALAMTLMVVSGLALRTLVSLMTLNPGFQGEPLAVVRFEAPAWKYAADDDVRRLAGEALMRIRAVPGVETAAAASAVPALDADVMTPIEIEGRPTPPGVARLAGVTVAGDSYFETLALPLLVGRTFTEHDRSGAQPVAVVSRTTADRFLGGVPEALGRRVRIDDAAALATVVGVVPDIANPDIDQPPNPVVYVPFAQRPARQIVILASSPDPDAIAGRLRDEMRRLDPDIAAEAATFRSSMRLEFAATRALVAIFFAFGGVAMALAASGLYGVIAFAVAQRTREFGVRVALGARPSDMRRLIVRQGGALIAAGLAAGLAGSVLLAQVAQGMLYGVSAGDPSTYFAVAALVVATAAVAIYVPARRAMRVDPIVALRIE